MKILVTAMALAGLAAASLQAATTPGTIISTSASAIYADSQGQTMPQEASNQKDVLVVSSQPERTVMLTAKSLYVGPSTVGRTVKVVGKISTDANGTWLSDGSTMANTAGYVRCKVSTLFLTQPLPTNQTVIITGISQIDGTGTPMIIPAGDVDIHTVTPQ